MLPPPPRSTLFPYTTLFRSRDHPPGGGLRRPVPHLRRPRRPRRPGAHLHRRAPGRRGRRGDRKSTRLNSSHANISYAVFCLKKKKKKNEGPTTPCSTQTSLQ